MNDQSSKRFVRLIDLLTAAAIVIVLACIFAPFLLHTRRSARQTECMANLMGIGLGLRNYHGIHRAFPFGTVGSRNLPPQQRFSWYVGVWPFVEGKAPILMLNENLPWNAAVNREPRLTLTSFGRRGQIVKLGFIKLFSCPLGPQNGAFSPMQTTHYIGLAGIGEDAPRIQVSDRRAGIWGFDRQTSGKNIHDGAETTILLIETSANIGPWLAGGDTTVRGVRPGQAPYFGRLGQFGGIHNRRVPTLFADGGTELLSSTMDPRIFEEMATIAGPARVEVESPTRQESHAEQPKHIRPNGEQTRVGAPS